MNRTVVLVGLIAITLLAAIGLSGGDDSPPATSPSQGIYDNLPLQYGEIIPSETDCQLLQDIFDTAENAADGHRENGRLSDAQDFTRVMSAADYRMERVGCYD